MKNIILISCFILANLLNAQQIVFTTINSSSQDEFWKVNVAKPFEYFNLSNAINKQALYNGINKGPISVSHNGSYYIFQSERFDNMIDGYEAITICKSDFSLFEVPKDAMGNAFHSEGIMQVSDDGKTIYFVQGGGTHDRDIFKTTKGASNWSNAAELTSSSKFAYNISPYLSYNEKKIIFESSASPSISTSIIEVSANGGTPSPITSIASIPNCKQMKSPCYDNSGNIYFESDTDAERIWKINSTGGLPFIINSSFTNDNSPITLPDGRIASLFIPNSTHQVKIMNSDGQNDFMVTSSSNLFDEVFDIGMSAGGSNETATVENQILSTLNVFPNPNNGLFKVEYKAISDIDLEIINCLGEICFSNKYSKWNSETAIDLRELPAGIYVIKINDEGLLLTHQVLLIK